MGLEMEKIYIHLENPQRRSIDKITEVLEKNGVVLLPGDTSYLLAAKIGSRQALEKLDKIKVSRKRKFYSIVLKDMRVLSKYTDISDSQYEMIKRFLPGPYTFILKASKQIPKIMLQKRKEVGIRIPDSPFIEELLEQFGEPIIVSTATKDGNVDFFTDPEMDEPDWLHFVDLVVDGGYVPAELTTIIHLEGDEYEIIREGSGSVEML